MKPLNFLVIAAMAGSVAVVAPGSLSACYECSQFQGQLGCVLGCPEHELDCQRYEFCESDGDSCVMSGPCGSLGSLFLEDVTVAGILASGEAVAEEDLADRFAAFTHDGGTVYRRSCDAAIMNRSYVPDVVTTMRHSGFELTI